MYFEELSPYSFKLPFSLANVLNIGWLDEHHKFTIGAVDKNFISKLRAAVELQLPGIDPHVNVIRGIHPCNICGADEIPIKRNNRPFYLGMSEIWLPYKTVWLASPSMLLHYIEKHHYLPPEEFLEAVSRLDMAAHYKGQEVYDRLIGIEMSRSRTE